jgi:RNA-directed DNA polymerase
VSDKALETFKQRVRQLTSRSGGRSIGAVIEKLRSYVPGWKAYFGLAQTSRVWRRLDEWMRRRMRALHLKHWRRGKTIYRELLKLGAKPHVAQSVAALSRCWWRNSLSALHSVLTIAYFDRLGMPRLT